MKTSLVALALLVFGVVITSQAKAEESKTADVNLTVQAGEISISTSGATLNLGTWEPNDTLSGQFPTNSFLVSDMKWALSGYYTTISVTDLTGTLYGETYTIPGENVKFRAWGTINVVTGNANPAIEFHTNVSTDTVITDPVRYIQRVNTGGWILWEYWDAPYVQVTIPAFQAATTYHGTITYTLMEIE